MTHVSFSLPLSPFHVISMQKCCKKAKRKPTKHTYCEKRKDTEPVRFNQENEKGKRKTCIDLWLLQEEYGKWQLEEKKDFFEKFRNIGELC